MDEKKFSGDFFPELNLPPAELKLARRNGLLMVFDPLRKKYVRLTSEEFVRQSFVYWLMNFKNYPASLLNNEVGIRLNNTIKRCDTVLFNPSGRPHLIIEFKAPDVKITQDVFNQISRYNLVMKAPYLIVSNGINHYCCRINLDTGVYSYLKEIPDYAQIKENKDD